MLFRSSLSPGEKGSGIHKSGGFSNGRGPQNPLAGLLKQESLGPTLRVSDPVYVGWDPRICISDMFPGGADALLCNVSTLKAENPVSSPYPQAPGTEPGVEKAFSSNC